MTKYRQRLRELITVGKEVGYAGHPEFECMQQSILRVVQAQVGGTETWLEKIRHDLYTAAVAARCIRLWTTGRLGQR
jgi:hypothetical protein